MIAKVQSFFETTKCFYVFLSIQPKKSRRALALRDERYVKEMYYSSIQFKIVIPSTRLKCFALFVTIIMLLTMYLETTGYQLFAFYTVEKWIGICLKGCGCYDFSFECSRVVRPASRLRESLMHEGQPQGIRRRVTASWRACHLMVK